MECPHCLIAFAVHAVNLSTNLGVDDDDQVNVSAVNCPDCGRLVGWYSTPWRDVNVFYPPVRAHKALSSAVPEALRTDYTEACAVLPSSAKASAALSRRILQSVLRDKGYKAGNLEKEIDKAVPHVSAGLGEVLHAVRHVGNFAAHPIKSTNTGEIVDVEPGEADWLIEILADVFDELYTKPANQRKRIETINVRLREAGKPELPLPDEDAGAAA